MSIPWSSTTRSTSRSCRPTRPARHTETYDLNGNLTSNGNGLTLAYNPLDQTTSINGTANTYDGEGQTQLTGAGSTTLQNDLLGLSRTSTSSDTIYLTRDLNNQVIDQRGSASGTFYPLVDGEGTIIALTNTSGQLANSYTYDPNGNRTATTGTAPANWGFQNGYLTTANLYHFAARYYNPLATTFTQQDPINNPGDLLQADRYPYAGDDPVNLADVKGKGFLDCAISIIGGGAAVGLGFATGPTGWVAVGSYIGAASAGWGIGSSC